MIILEKRVGSASCMHKHSVCTIKKNSETSVKYFSDKILFFFYNIYLHLYMQKGYTYS